MLLVGLPQDSGELVALPQSLAPCTAPFSHESAVVENQGNRQWVTEGLQAGGRLVNVFKVGEQGGRLKAPKMPANTPRSAPDPNSDPFQYA